jgi:putative membrane protein
MLPFIWCARKEESVVMDTKQTDTNSTTELARVRTRQAADRTLMAWIRTSLSLIGFGFTANKVLGVLEAGKSASPLHSTLVFALSFIALGTFGLLGAVIQYSRMLKHLQVHTSIYQAPRSLTGAVAILLVVIGLFTFIAVVVQ